MPPRAAHHRHVPPTSVQSRLSSRHQSDTRHKITGLQVIKTNNQTSSSAKYHDATPRMNAVGKRSYSINADLNEEKNESATG